MLERNFSIAEYYAWTWTIIDPRVDGWLLMSSGKPITFLIISYFIGTYIGYKLMRNRKPFDLKWVMTTYNIVIALFNLYIVYEFISGAIGSKYNWICDLTNINATDYHEMRVVKGTFLYMVSKEIEWLDTLFFILRKSDRQLTKLHLYHHTSTAVIGWMVCRWAPSGSTFFPLMLNSAVHVIMYTYYALSTLGPSVQKYLWWKRYLTQIQMVQFVIMMGQSLNGLRIGCRYTVFIQYLMVGYMISFLILFGMFYKFTYKNKKQITSFKAQERNGIYKLESNGKYESNGICKEPHKDENGYLHTANGIELRHRTASSN